MTHQLRAMYASIMGRVDPNDVLARFRDVSTLLERAKVTRDLVLAAALLKLSARIFAREGWTPEDYGALAGVTFALEDAPKKRTPSPAA